MHAMTMKEWRDTPLERLVELHDKQAESTEVGLDFIRDEIARRDQELQAQEMMRLSQDMHRLTDEMHRMTKVILWATILACAVSAVSLLVSLFK